MLKLTEILPASHSEHRLHVLLGERSEYLTDAATASEHRPRRSSGVCLAYTEILPASDNDHRSRRGVVTLTQFRRV